MLIGYSLHVPASSFSGDLFVKVLFCGVGYHFGTGYTWEQPQFFLQQRCCAIAGVCCVFALNQASVLNPFLKAMRECLIGGVIHFINHSTTKCVFFLFCCQLVFSVVNGVVVCQL